MPTPSTPPSGIDLELIALAHLYFQQHVPVGSAPRLCACLRPYPCSQRGWAIDYLVQAGRLVLAQPGPPRPRGPSDGARGVG